MIVDLVGPVAVAMITWAVARSAPDGPGGISVETLIAFGLAALVAVTMALQIFVVGALLALLAPFPGTLAMAVLGRRGSRGPAVALSQPPSSRLTSGSQAFAACGISDACCH